MKKDVAKILKRLNILACIVVLILSYLFVFTRLFQQNGFADMQSFFQNFDVSSQLFSFIFLFLLMFVNWGIEAKKWQYLLKNIYKISFLQSLKSTFLGVCVSFIFPNRIGDFIGRGFSLSQGYALQGSMATIVGNFSQLIITLILGCFGGVFCLFSYYFQKTNVFFVCISIVGFILILCILLGIYFKMNKIYLFFNKKEWFQRINWTKKLSFFQNYTPKNLCKVLLLSFCRYIVFSSQLLFTFHFLGIEFSLFLFVMMSFIYFLLTSVIPTWVLSELGVRASVALFVFGNIYFELTNIHIADSIIILATLFLWLINVVVPALLGSFFVFSLRLFRWKSIS